MNKLQLLILLVGIFSTLVGCKKDNNANPIVPSKKVATIFFNNDPTETFEYNSDGKLSKLSYGTQGYDSYTYSGNTIFILHYYNGSASYDTLVLNSQGYVSKMSNGSRTITYEYNDGYCVKESWYGGTSIMNYEYVNGNLVTDGTVTYEYYLDKANTIDNEHCGINFRGKTSKNLVKQTIYSNGSGSDIYTYTYEYDQDNYVTKRTIKRNDVLQYWSSYVYK
jgi:hypothetical protein